LNGDMQCFFDRRREDGARHQAGFGIAFLAENDPARHPGDGFVFADGDLFQTELPGMIGARVIPVLDDE
jgi:hypothetical protein